MVLYAKVWFEIATYLTLGRHLNVGTVEGWSILLLFMGAAVALV